MPLRRRFRPGILVACTMLAVPAAGLAAPQADEFERLSQDFNAAQTTFDSIVTQPDSIPMFSRLISVLQRRVTADPTAADLDLLVRSLTFRARAQFNNGAEQAAADDIRALLNADPNTEVDRILISPRFLDVFDSIYDQIIGFIEFGVSPADIELRVDGVLLEAGVISRSLVAGTHALVLERPGYQAIQEEIEVAAGDSVFVDHQLIRMSAVVRILTRPGGARVSVDGSAMGFTGGTAPADFVPTGDAAIYPRSEFSAELVVDNLQPGAHVVEVALDGYRPMRYDLGVSDLADYQTAIVLAPTAGIVVLEGLPADAAVTVDGVPETPQFSGAGGSPRLTLPPGEHVIEVSQGTGGVFAGEVTLADQQTEVLQVVLRPGLVLLGVLGGDARGARNLSAALADRLAAFDDCALLDRTYATGVVESVGVTTDTLRGAADAPIDTIDWAAVQAAVDRETPGSVYMLGVLDDDLVATYADLWIWPSAPGPPQPDRVRVNLASAADIASLGSAFVASTLLQGPWFGALLVDLDDAALVAAVTAGSPAEAAGLHVGDRVVSVGGDLVDGAASANAVIEASAPGTALAVQVQRGGATEIAEVTLGTTPMVISPSDPDLVYSVISASLAAEAAGGTATSEDWVVKLNQAAVLLHASAWEDAVRTLRSVEGAPRGPGVGDATVQYWLGIALTALGPSYHERAIQAFRDAAADPEARLFSNDGPWIAPRANARLAELGGLR